MKRILITLIAMVALAAGAWTWLLSAQQTIPEHATTPAGAGQQEPQIPATEVFLEEPGGLFSEGDMDDWRGRRSARRIVEVPDKVDSDQAESHRFDDIENIEQSELEAFTRYNLDRGLEGDLNAANRVVHALRRCERAPRSLQEVEHEVQRRQSRERWVAENRNPNHRVSGEAELREQFMARFEDCAFREQMFTGDLRARLLEMAESGHVTARYLYALWPPEIYGRSDAFLRQQEWAERALTFTLANLTEGETAGLLAFGQSYANSGTFTSRDRMLGTAFIIAALDCGLELEYYASYVNNFLNAEHWDQMFQDPRTEVLTMADGLKTFCR
ncbi:MAG: hypothetical protein R3348_02460 [Xanthomonadales bacterium]|nr:hypothetical protein [Xanthomonadales bacterium]